MRKNNNIWLFLILVGLGAGAYYLLKNVDAKKSDNSWDRHFAIENINEVQKIFIAQRGKENITLSKKGKDWWINDTYLAANNPVENLLEVMNKMSMSSIPPKNAYENIMKGLAAYGIKIEAYNGKNENLKTYYVGGVSNDESEVYCIMEKSNQPYAMALPHMTSNIRERFDLEFDDWRDRSFIRENVDNIEGVRISYPYTPISNFSILKKDGQWILLDQNGAQDQNAKTELLRKYMTRFEGIGSEAIINQNKSREKVRLIPPLFKIELKVANKDSIVANFYPANPTTNDLDLSDEFIAKRDFFRFFVDVINGDYYLAQIQQFADLMKTRADFYGGSGKE